MLIPVVYPDERHDMVKPEVLDQLLDGAAIKRFRRAEGWVEVDVGPLRSGRRVYAVPERRASMRQSVTLQ